MLCHAQIPNRQACTRYRSQNGKQGSYGSSLRLRKKHYANMGFAASPLSLALTPSALSTLYEEVFSAATTQDAAAESLCSGSS